MTYTDMIRLTISVTVTTGMRAKADSRQSQLLVFNRNETTTRNCLGYTRHFMHGRINGEVACSPHIIGTHGSVGAIFFYDGVDEIVDVVKPKGKILALVDHRESSRVSLANCMARYSDEIVTNAHCMAVRGK